MNGVTTTTPTGAAAGTAAQGSQAQGSQTEPNADASTPKAVFGNSDFQTFLTMLTTQIQNQDPMNPMQSTEFASQLAAFSSVEQQVRTNTLLESMSTQMGQGGIGQMAAWVGMEARAEVPAIFDGAPLTLYPKREAGAESAVLVAYDAAGREVGRNALPAAEGPVVWAGTDADGAPLPAGSYSFAVENMREGVLSTRTAVETYGTISEVRSGTAGAELVFLGGGTAKPADITALRDALVP